MHGLTEDLSQGHEANVFRFFSRYPFYQRPESGPQDAFERDALAFFEGNAEAEAYSRVETIGGERVLRYAVALRMAESCVGCHNSHADSPKLDWTVGELRGVQAVSQPVGFFSAWSAAHGGTWLFVLCGVSIALVLAIVTTIVLLAWRHIDLKDAHARIETLVWQDAVCDLTEQPST